MGSLSVISGGTQLWVGVDASAGHVEEKCAFSSQMHIAQRCSERRPTPKPYQEKESLFGPMFVCSGLYPELNSLFFNSPLMSIAPSPLSGVEHKQCPVLNYMAKLRL